MKNYETLKPITVENIIKYQLDKRCPKFKSHLGTFIVRVNCSLARQSEGTPISEIEPHFKEYPEWETFLVDKSFIRIAKKEPKLELTKLNDTTYILSDVSLGGCNLMSININSGTFERHSGVNRKSIWKLDNMGRVMSDTNGEYAPLEEL